MLTIPRPLVAATCCLVALVLVAAPAAAQWSLPRLGGGPPLEPAAMSTGPVIVVVWTTWSPRGRNIVERLNKLEADWGDRARVISVVFQESAQTVQGFLAGKKLVPPVYLDSDNADFSKRYNVSQVPRLLVFKDGVIAVNVNLTDDPNPLIAGAVQ